MKEMVLNYLIDSSDQAYARYALICPSCNREWCSTQMADANNVSAETQKKLAAAEAEIAARVQATETEIAARLEAAEREAEEKTRKAREALSRIQDKVSSMTGFLAETASSLEDL